MLEAAQNCSGNKVGPSWFAWEADWSLADADKNAVCSVAHDRLRTR